MPKTAIVGGTLLDTSSVTPEPTKQTLLVEDGRITAWLEPHEPVEVDVIDAEGLWVLPGLIDAHFHPFLVDIDPSVPRHMHTLAREVSTALRTLETWLESGVTTVRSAGAHENLDVELRELVERGIVRGPRIFASGYLIAMTSGLRAGNEKIALEVTGADRAREVARKQIKAGVDSLKLYTSSSVGGGGGRLMGPPGWPHLNEDEIRAVVEEAENAGLPTLAHATSPEAVKNCLRAGVHCIEHASRLDDEAIEMLVERDVPIVPTLAIAWSLATFGEERGFGKHIAESARKQQPERFDSLMRAKRAGVRVAAGTDADNSRCLLREECRLLVEAGFTPYEALRAATYTSAEVVRSGNVLGTLRPGARADIVLLERNPLQDIANLATVRGVIQGGKVVYWKSHGESESRSKTHMTA